MRMLPLEEQENLSFQNIVEQAKESIQKRYPSWTNYNPADSGMALLELFAYMTELQQFHVEQMGKSHLLVFLHLLGISPKGIQPAEVYGAVKEITCPFWLLRGAKARAGNIVFETKISAYLEKDNLMMQTTPFYPFDRNPVSGTSCELRLRDRLEEYCVHTLYIQLDDDYPIVRNTVEEDFIPLVSLGLEYYDGEEYRSGQIISDTTFGLLQSGILQFCLGGRMKEQKGEYKLRITMRGEYDTAPQISGITFNMIPFVQRDTIREYQKFCVPLDGKDFYEVVSDSWYTVCGDTRVYVRTESGYRETERYAVYDDERRHFVFAGEVFKELSGEAEICLISDCPGIDKKAFTMEGNGMPCQQFYLPDKNVLGEGFILWVEESSGYYRPWFRVQDFAQAGHRDRCYVLEEEEGILKFGDGRQGVMPKGNIEITAYAVCAGAGGNIRRNRMSGFVHETRAKRAVNPSAATGGRGPETIEECFKRYEEEAAAGLRAVVCRDYEEIIRKTPGLRVKRVKVIHSGEAENSLEVMVQPFTNDGRRMQGDGYERNVMRVLGKKKMLGTQIIMKKTEDVRIYIRLEVMVKSHYPDGKERIEEKMKRYFDEQMDFGKPIIYGHVFGYIDSLPETAGIRNLTIRARGRGVSRDNNQDIHLPFHGMAYLEELEIRGIPTEET